MTQIEIPQFDWAGFYYPQILESLIEFKRLNVPELTDESPQEPLIQLLRAFACVGHLNNTLVDLIANESTLPTAQLVSTVRNMLRLIDYEMPSATPAQVDVVYELGQVLSTTTEVVPQYARAATTPGAGEPARDFEALSAISTARTDQLTSALAVESSSFTDVTSEANSAPGTSTFSPWVTPLGGSSTSEGDAIYLCHSGVMWDKLNVNLTVVGAGLVGIWEYYDGVYEKGTPDSVVDQGTTLRFNLDTVLGSTSTRIGTKVRVRLNSTGAYADAFSDYDGANYVTVSLLGQVTPSTTPSDYTVGAAWEPLIVTTGDSDGTADLTQSGDVVFSLPQTTARNWRKGTFENVTGYWIRYRLLTVSSPTSPTVGQIKIDVGKQYALALVTQGRRQVDDPLGSSDGTTGQTFTSTQDNVIDGTSSLTVDGVTWVEVDSFLSSKPTDRHYRVELGEDDRATFVFGDGVSGAIPPPGVGNVAVSYRWNAGDNGNVGADTVVNDKSGLTYAHRLWNPRAASGWKEAAGASTASLELAKLQGPASLRVRDVAISPSDVEALVVRAAEIDSSLAAVTRARAIEEGFGAKTIELVIVAAGGALAAQATLDAMSEFFNGDQFSSPVKVKRVVANQEVTAVNYTARTVNVTVSIATSGTLTVAQVENKLTQLLQPEALQSDGLTYVWDFGGRVPVSKLQHEIFTIDAAINDVDVTVPASDIQLDARELPVVGSLSVTVL